MAVICGCSACIFFIDFMLVIFSGNSAKLMKIVTRMMDQP